MTQLSAVPATRTDRRRVSSFAAKVALLLAATAIVAAPSALFVESASAATPFAVLMPVAGSTVGYVSPTFSGIGVTEGDTVRLTYVSSSESTVSATKYVGSPTIGADLLWSTPTNFDQLAKDQKSITVTAAEYNGDVQVGASLTRQFSTDRATNLTAPFAVTSPTTLQVVTTTTPTLTGSAAPGDTISVTYGQGGGVVAAAAPQTLAGTSFSIALDLSGVQLTGGVLNNLGLTVSRTPAAGTAAYVDSALTVTVQYRPAAITPTPTPSPTPTPTPTPSPTDPAVTPTPTPSSTPVLAAGTGTGIQTPARTGTTNTSAKTGLAYTGAADTLPVLVIGGALLLSGVTFLLVRRLRLRLRTR